MAIISVDIDPFSEDGWKIYDECIKNRLSEDRSPLGLSSEGGNVCITFNDDENKGENTLAAAVGDLMIFDDYIVKSDKDDEDLIFAKADAAAIADELEKQAKRLRDEIAKYSSD